jgi:hypothetical protein
MKFQTNQTVQRPCTQPELLVPNLGSCFRCTGVRDLRERRTGKTSRSASKQISWFKRFAILMIDLKKDFMLNPMISYDIQICLFMLVGWFNAGSTSGLIMTSWSTHHWFMIRARQITFLMVGWWSVDGRFMLGSSWVLVCWSFVAGLKQICHGARMVFSIV